MSTEILTRPLGASHTTGSGSALGSLSLIVDAAYQTARISLPTVLESALGRLEPNSCDARLDAWSRRLLDAAKVRLVLSGTEHIAAGQHYVVMSNHQSLYDIPVLFQALKGLRLRMVAKTELFRIPVWSQAMTRAGFIEVDREDGQKARAALGQVRERMKSEQLSVWIAPEGTRSQTGELGEFKRGGFHLALAAGVPILPVAISGTRHVLGAKSWRIQRGEQVSVRILPPLDPGAYGFRKIRALVAETRLRIAEGLELRSGAATETAKD